VLQKIGTGRNLDIDRGETRRAARRAAKRRKLVNRQSFGPAFDRMNCIDCGINVVAVGDYCMVNADVWKRLGLTWLNNLSIPCLERRCGHEFIGAEEIAPNKHICDDPDRALIRRMMTRGAA
jgi:hypothetical protein